MIAACLAQSPKPTKKVVDALIISHNGASIDYPGCTDLAYKKAINDGADIIDCNVQMTKDGVAFCLDSADLLGKTNAAMAFMDRSTSVPEIQPKNGVFTFDVTWTEIKSVKRKFSLLLSWAVMKCKFCFFYLFSLGCSINSEPVSVWRIVTKS